ncbi:hypothetical protein GCM10020256_47780 [Streptomyces thermocoprophilus]
MLKDVPGSITMNAATDGTSSSAAEMIVQFRPAEDRHGEGVGDADDRADQRHHRRQQELVRGGEPVLRSHEEDEHGPQGPDGEADVLGEDGEEKIAPGDLLSRLLPERLVLRIPVPDPATAPARGCGGQYQWLS